MEKQESNAYLGEVLEQQQKVDMELRRRVSPAMQAAVVRGGGGGGGARAVDYRITGWWRFKTVVVPPNVYVIHTRRGHAEPLHIGMGVSFGFNPYTDAFLVIPAAMQTIVISARCICRDRQGILVQSYVQWIIEDIATAYRRLDFSDAEDPMRIVNVQLREQAEAAIKDKVATLGIDEVLADKQPIIEELTTRLRTVAEGSHGASGLGLKIVTVQIKEAVVSSTRVWENLQKPFRAERERLARMAELEAQRQITARELEIRQVQETATMETQRALDEERARSEREAYDRAQTESARRMRIEQDARRAAVAEATATARAQADADLELALHKVETEKVRLEAQVAEIQARTALDGVEAERSRNAAAQEIEVNEMQSEAEARVHGREIEADRLRREVENNLSEALVRMRLIEALPEVAERMPAPKELKAISIQGGEANAGVQQLAGLVASVMALVEKKKE